jgi:hypothetical protein
MTRDTAEWGTADWRPAAAEAREVLQMTIGASLEAVGWLRVQGALAGLEAAVAVTDVESLWRGIAHLERLGPSRVATRLGDPAKEPIPEGIRERINVLIDALLPDDGRVPPGPDGGQDPEPADGTPAS